MLRVLGTLAAGVLEEGMGKAEAAVDMLMERWMSLGCLRESVRPRCRYTVSIYRRSSKQPCVILSLARKRYLKSHHRGESSIFLYHHPLRTLSQHRRRA